MAWTLRCLRPIALLLCSLFLIHCVDTSTDDDSSASPSVTPTEPPVIDGTPTPIEATPTVTPTPTMATPTPTTATPTPTTATPTPTTATPTPATVTPTPEIPTPSAVPVDADGDGFDYIDDCDDADAAVYPGADEPCDGKDHDCDGLAAVPPTWYLDRDDDGYGATADAFSACTVGPGYVSLPGDCDDHDAAIHPNALEACNALDDDCDGEVDEDLETSPHYADADGDGYGAGDPVPSCGPLEGFTVVDGDCNETDAAIHPDAQDVCDGKDNDCDLETDEEGASTWYTDQDGDGHGAPGTGVLTCDSSGLASAGDDCDDSRSQVYPGATEVCDGIDDDCDGTVDEGVLETFYADADQDGFGDPGTVEEACEVPDGYIDNALDCADENATVNPGAQELCNAWDDNCDGQIDEGVKETFYADADSDGHGDPDVSSQACYAPDGYVSTADDCNDEDGSAYPGALEVCDGQDNDCDGATDEDGDTTFYRDVDGDGYGNDRVTTLACSAPDGYVAAGGDCNDQNEAIYPSAEEVCNARDDNCDGNIDEGVRTTWYLDADGDGYGRSSGSVVACAAPSDNYVEVAGDCNDLNSSISPGATEVCNGVDDNCDGNVDEGVENVYYADSDGDGYGNLHEGMMGCAPVAGFVTDSSDCDDTNPLTYPGALELCDGVDNDCNFETTDDQALGDNEDCAAIDCDEIHATRTDAPSGFYYIDPDGQGAFDVFCEMTVDGGGWTLVASFNNNDGVYNWTKYASTTNNLGNWRTRTGFGDLETFEEADYKGPAYWRLSGSSLLALDSGGGWASYGNALTGTLYDTVTAYTACQTTVLAGVTVRSSDATVASVGKLSYYGGDPNNSSLCAFNFQDNATDSSVMDMAHQGCGSGGFGHVGWYTGTEHTDWDHLFCLSDQTMITNTSSSCGAWYGVVGITWFDPKKCEYALLLVR